MGFGRGFLEGMSKANGGKENKYTDEDDYHLSDLLGELAGITIGSIGKALAGNNNSNDKDEDED